jgi:uncharacterized protein
MVAGVSMLRSTELIVPRAGIRLIVVTLAYVAAAGFLVGLTSIGSGSLILPLIIIVNRLPIVRAVGTDIIHAAILVAFSAALHVSIGAVNWEAVPWLLAGSMPGVVIGSRLAPRLPERSLRFVVLAVLLVSAFRLLS